MQRMGTLGRQARGMRAIGLSTRLRLEMGYGLRGSYTPISMGDDWEFVDGTPAPRTAAKSFEERARRAYIEQIVEACATVEEMAEKNQLPLRPGTDKIRRFDPMCPLYLPINDVVMDSSTSPEMKHEIYGNVAPYINWNDGTAAPSARSAGAGAAATDAGDGTPVDAETAKEATDAKTAKKRRKKVARVKQHWRFLQPSLPGQQAGPYGPSNGVDFNLGHGGAN